MGGHFYSFYKKIPLCFLLLVFLTKSDLIIIL